MRLQKTLRRQEELKVLELTVGPTPVDNIGTGFPLYCNGLGIGNTILTRIGRKVLFKFLFLRVSCHIPTGATSDNSNHIRVIIVSDKLANGRTPNWTNTDGPFQEISFDSPMSVVNPKRFAIVYERMFNLSFGGPACAMNKRNIRLNKIATYSGDTNVIANHMSNAHWIYAISDSTAANHPVLRVRGRYRYVDM